MRGSDGEIGSPSGHARVALRRRSPAFAGRIVVALVVTIMIIITTIAVLVARTAVSDVSGTSLHEITIAGRQVLVSRGGPPLDLVGFSLLAVLIIAVCCLGLEVIAALLSISPRGHTSTGSAIAAGTAGSPPRSASPSWSGRTTRRRPSRSRSRP